MLTHEKAGPSGRYSSVNHIKSEGATYTPSRLAQFVAAKIVDAWEAPINDRTARVLDPAMGDGELLLALVNELRNRYPHLRIEVFGFELDQGALNVANSRLSIAFPDIPIHLAQHDFLGYVLEHFSPDEQTLFFQASTAKKFDLVIANPPYVRTQIMGAQQSRLLGKQFGLSGRIDLYHAFMIGIARVVDAKGIAGMIVSNRFMTTRAGATVRSNIQEQLQVLSVWDFGDTKLFDVAVLPAVVIAGGSERKQQSMRAFFASIYQTDRSHETRASDPIEAISHNGVVQINDGRNFVVSHGELNTDKNNDGIWRVANQVTETWLTTVKNNTWGTFRDIGKIRVGVKTCADKVFIRSDWNSLPSNVRPELLRPLTTHHAARRFKAIAQQNPKFILYPHELRNGVRKSVNLAEYPKSAAYLKDHRSTLERRTYLSKSGRDWFEIWVPQDPSAWNKIKLVFRDIAQEPTFWVDQNRSVVNGDCYWLAPDADSKINLLWLAAAVGNSSFIEKFYDYRFHNRLYAGRRRFMTQYVEQFPLPNPHSELGRTIVERAKETYEAVGTEDATPLQASLNTLVWDAFGLPVEEVAR